MGRVPSFSAIRKNSHAARALATERMPASAQSPNHTAPSTIGIAMIANSVRCARFERPRRSRGGALASVMVRAGPSGGNLSEAPLAALILEDRGEEIAAREVGPHHGNDVKLRVRQL